MPQPSEWPVFGRISGHVLGRRCGSALAYLASELPGMIYVPGMKGLPWESFYRHEANYHAARIRLLEKGIVGEITRKGEVRLELTSKGESSLPAFLRAEREWKRKWNGIWYQVSYDVPEAKRHHRDVLRTVLQGQRFGQLHKSLWIGPWDIRPLFDDLREGAGITDHAVLFQARTVMGGVPDQQIVRQAWPWDRILAAQASYLGKATSLIEAWERSPPRRASLPGMVREEAIAYAGAMEGDPLLPRSLWPTTYLGPDVYTAHKRLLKVVAATLGGS